MTKCVVDCDNDMLKYIEEADDPKNNLLEIYIGEEKVYSYRGLYKIQNLDDENLVVIEAGEENAISIIHSINNEPFVNRFVIPKGTQAFTTEEMLKSKKIIIPCDGRYAVYSYEFGIITSAWYDKIVFDEGYYYVEYKIEVSGQKITLFGILDSEGHLIEDELYSPLLKDGFIVDEHNLEASILGLYTKIERILAKMKKIRLKNELIAYEIENESILRRKRKSTKNSSN